MNKATSILFIILMMGFHVVFGQVEVVEIRYDSITKSLSFDDVPKSVKAHKTYVLMLTHINSAHINVVSQLRAYDYVADLPDLLKPIFVGIPNNNVMGQFELQSDGKNTKLFLDAMSHYDKLQIIRMAGNDYYEKTKYQPIPRDTLPLYNLKQTLSLETVKEIANQIIMSEQFIASALTSYETAIATIHVRDPILSVIHAEYATLVNIKKRINSGMFEKSLDFLIRSEHAEDELYVDTFTATKDVTELHLQVINTYTGSTLFEGDLHFKTYHNWSFDFTTGFFFSNLVEKHYYKEDRDEVSQYIREENIPRIDLAIGALGHLSYKFSSKLMAGISIGASLSPFDGKLRYLTGTSILFGERKFLALNIGVAFAKIATLSDSIKYEEGYFQSADIASINTVDRIKTGLYIGMTYNFINKKQ